MIALRGLIRAISPRTEQKMSGQLIPALSHPPKLHLSASHEGAVRRRLGGAMRARVRKDQSADAANPSGV